MSEIPRVYQAMPHYNGLVHIHAGRAWAGPFATKGKLQIFPRDCGGSLLANVFNQLWCEMRNFMPHHKFNLLSMIHADVAPQEHGFLDTMYDEMNAKGADLISVVIPIKDNRDITSTAAWVPGGYGGARVRRLTRTEIYRQLPETFDEADMNAAGIDGMLCINTGLFLCKVDTGDWIKEVLFNISDKIFEDDTHCWAECMPEDWKFSKQLKDMGKKVCATRKVHVKHWGPWYWDNTDPALDKREPWTRDEDFFADPLLGAPAIAAAKEEAAKTEQATAKEFKL